MVRNNRLYTSAAAGLARDHCRGREAAAMTVTVLNAMLRQMLESQLPDWVEPRWFASTKELHALAPEAEIGWFDSYDFPASYEAARLGTKLKWLNTLAAQDVTFVPALYALVLLPLPLSWLLLRYNPLARGVTPNAVATKDD